MRVTILLIISNFLIITSCKKQSFDSVKDITGEWEWMYTKTVYPSDPITPENTGNHETLIFCSDRKWILLVNSVNLDSGIYSLGHGNYSPYPGASNFIYDSVVFSGQSLDKTLWDYYDIHGDTLQFCPGYAGKMAAYNSYVFPDGFNGSKFYKKK
jgi:hypothetical protein